MQQRIVTILTENREQISLAWAERVHTSSGDYEGRPLEEIRETARRIVDALVDVFTTGSYERVNAALREVAQRRQAMGFEASDVEHALLLGCDAIYPALESELGNDVQQLVWSVTQIQRALHRALGLLAVAYQETGADGASAEACQGARAQQALSRARLDATLGALRMPACAVSPDGGTVWLREGSHSAAAPEGLQHQCGDPATCAVCTAFASGEPQPGTDGAIAVPVLDDDGVAVEVIVLYPPEE